MTEWTPMEQKPENLFFGESRWIYQRLERAIMNIPDVKLVPVPTCDDQVDDMIMIESSNFKPDEFHVQTGEHGFVLWQHEKGKMKRILECDLDHYGVSSRQARRFPLDVACVITAIKNERMPERTEE